MGGARHYTELIAWQLADEIRRLVFPLTRRADYRADFRLRAQTDDDTDATDTDADTGTGTGTGTDGPVPSAASTPSTPPADRRPPTKDTR